MKTFTLGAMLLLAACSTPNIQPPRSGASGATGDAEADASGLDSYLLYTGAGSTGVLNPVRNEDRTSSAQTAPIFQLVLSPGSTADSDAVATEIVKMLNAEEDPAAKLLLLQRLETRMDKVAAMNNGRFGALSHAGLYVVNIMSNGEEVQKLDAATVEAGGKGLAAAIGASLNATK